MEGDGRVMGRAKWRVMGRVMMMGRVKGRVMMMGRVMGRVMGIMPYFAFFCHLKLALSQDTASLLLFQV